MSSAAKAAQAMRLTAAILWFLALILILIMFISFVRRKKEYHLKFQAPLNLSISLFVFVIVAGLNFFYVHLFRGLRMNEMVGITWCSIVGIACLMMEFTLIQCLFVNRLSIVFKNSSFDYPAWFYILMYSVIIIMVISVFIGELIGITIIKGIGLFLVIFNCIFLTLLFIYSLKKVLNSETERSLRADNDNNNNNDDETNQTQQILPIQIMIKFIVLLSLSMTSSAIFGVFLVAQDLEQISHISLNGMVWMFQSIDSSINMISVYFQFKVFEDRYFRFFGGYHEWIGITFFNQSKRASNLTSDIEQPPNTAVTQLY